MPTSARRSVLTALAVGAVLALSATAAAAAEVKVAVAANFTEPAREIAARFKARTGHDAILGFGSSGQFFAQIANGAEAIVPVPGGFILSGSAGAIREWRPNGGFCDPVERLVLQTLRFWSPIEGGYLVTGTDPNAGDGTAPVTIFHVEE